MTDSRPRIAVFIDADNIGLAYAPSILKFLAGSWDPYLKRAYGRNLSQHETILRENGIVPIEVLQNTSNKNAADIALIIDALEELFRGNGEAFCIVSGDADFTRLVQRIREAGKTVLVCGTTQTPVALRSACTQFLYLQFREKQKEPNDGQTQKPKPAKPEAKPNPPPPDPFNRPEVRLRLRTELRRAFLDYAAGAAEVDLSQFAAFLSSKRRALSHKHYGVRHLSRFLQKVGGFHVQYGEGGGLCRCSLDPLEDPALIEEPPQASIDARTETPEQNQPPDSQTGSGAETEETGVVLESS